MNAARARLATFSRRYLIAALVVLGNAYAMASGYLFILAAVLGGASLGLFLARGSLAKDFS